MGREVEGPAVSFSVNTPLEDDGTNSAPWKSRAVGEGSALSVPATALRNHTEKSRLPGLALRRVTASGKDPSRMSQSADPSPNGS